MVGYSALTGRDPARALHVLEEHRSILRSAFAGHGGREVKTIGDAFMVEFPDGLAAVRCALEFLEAIDERNLTVIPSERVRIRVGVHTGEVFEKDGDLYGDDVNIAARIEPMAEPGTVCVSSAVHEEIRGQIDSRVVRLGRAELKNIDRIPTLRLVMPEDERTSGVAVRARFYSRQPRIRRLVQAVVLIVLAVTIAFAFRPPPPVSTLALADITNATGDPDLDGLSGLLATALEQSPTLAVVTRSRLVDALGRMGKDPTARIDEGLAAELCRFAEISTFVRGSVRRFGEVYVLEASLVDAETGRATRGLSVRGERKESIPGLIESLAERLRAKLGEEQEEIERTHVGLPGSTTDDLAVYRLYFEGEQNLARGDFAAAQGSFEASVKLDPEFALGWQRLGYVLGWRGVTGANDAVREALKRRDSVRTRRERSFLAIQEANLAGDRERQVSLLASHLDEFPDDKEALFQLGDMRHHHGELAEGLALFDRVLALDPSFERAIDHRMWALLALGRVDEARAASEEFTRRHPSVASFRGAGELLLAAGLHEEARATFERARRTFPESVELRFDPPAVDALSGRLEAARAALRSLERDDAIRADPSSMTTVLSRLALLDTLAGRTDEADGLLAKASSAMAEGEGDARTLLAAERAFLLAWGGRGAAARPHIAHVLASGRLENRYILLAIVLACGRLEDLACLERLPNPHNHQVLADGFRHRTAKDHLAAAAAFGADESFANFRVRAAYATLESEEWLQAGQPERALAAARVGRGLRFTNSVDAIFHPLAWEAEADALEALARPGEAATARRKAAAARGQAAVE